MKSFARDFELDEKPLYFDEVHDTFTRCFDDKVAKTLEGYVTTNSKIGIRPRKDMPMQIMPGMYSGHPRSNDFYCNLADNLSEKFPVSKADEYGYSTGNCVNRSFDSIRTVAGHPMNPGGTPNPLSFISDRKLTIMERRLLSSISRLLFREYIPASVSVSTVSNTGSIDFSYDWDIKYTKSLNALNNIEDFMDLFIARDWIGLWRKYDHIPVVTKTTRWQVDTINKEGNTYVPKTREVVDFYGRPVKADKSYDYHSFMSRVRERTAWAYPQLPNIVGQAVQAGYRKGYYKNYGRTLHHTSGADIANKLSDFSHNIGLDAKQFDQNVTKEMVWIMIDSMNVSDKFKAYCKAMYSLPLVVENDYAGERGALLLNVTDYPAGIPSGIFAVSDWGKPVGIMLTILPAIHAGIIDLPDDDEELDILIDVILKGNHKRLGVLNAGDDAIGQLNSNEDKEKYLNEMDKTPIKLEIELPITFLGNTFIKEGARIKAMPDINSYVERWWIPEHGLGSMHRKYAPLGYFDREILFSANPSFRDVKTIIDKTYKQYFYSTPEQNMARMRAKLPPMPEAKSIEDILFLSNPDAIHYKLDVDKVSKDLVESYYISFEPERVEKYVKNLI